MIQQNELITFLVGIGVALFILPNRRRILQIPGSPYILLSFAALLAGWGLTVAEGFFLGDLLNLLEHACYMISSVAAAVWCWIVLVRKGGVR
jgi:hypothetical protein